jgi:hypothetical protein
MVCLIVGLAFHDHGRMARDGHGLPKVSLGPVMAYSSIPCGCLPLKWLHGRAGGLRPSYYPFGYPRPCASAPIPVILNPQSEVAVLRKVCED